MTEDYNSKVQKLKEVGQFQDLEGLVELAEEVDSSIDTFVKYSERLMLYRITLFIFSSIIIGAVLSLLLGSQILSRLSLETNILYSIGFILIGLLFSYTAFQFNKGIARTKKKIESEQLILKDLLNMIHEYKGLAYEDISIVKKALLEMRLNRIGFSNGKKYDGGVYKNSLERPISSEKFTKVIP